MTNTARRIARLRDEMRRKNIDVFFISRLPDIKWLSGYTGTSAYVLISSDEAVFITDGRYETQCRQELDAVWDLQIIHSYRQMFTSLGRAYTGIFVQPVLDVGTYHVISSFGADINVDTDDLLLRLRMFKDASEIAALKDEYDRAGKAFLKSLESWKFGSSERSWAALLEYNMNLLGAKGASFETIVASGVRGALPHGVASDKLITEDEAVTIDFGSIDLYNSDYTRVVYNGNDREILNIIDVVRAALEKAVDFTKPGVKCADIDGVARDYIDSKGFGPYFNHGLGHGVGMEVHELPHISSGGEDITEAGMVFTIEPGIYLPGRFGIRLEQTVAVTETGCTLLSTMLDKYVYKL